jgi:hypothetical protein
MTPFLFAGLPHLHNAPVSRGYLKTCLSVVHTADLELFYLEIIEQGEPFTIRNILIYGYEIPDNSLRKC